MPEERTGLICFLHRRFLILLISLLFFLRFHFFFQSLFEHERRY